MDVGADGSGVRIVCHPLSAGAQVTNSVRRVCLPTSESIKCLASIHSMQVTNSPQCR